MRPVAVEGHLLDDVRHDPGGTEAGHADALGAEVDRERLGEPDDRMLRRHVRQAVVAVGEQPGGRCRVHDVAGPLGDDPGEEHRQAPHDAHEIDVHDAFPRVEWDVLDVADDEDAHVVHHQVDAAEALDASCRTAWRSSTLVTSHRRRDRLAAELVRDLLARSPSRSVTTTRPAGGEGVRAGSPDATACSGDDGDGL